MRRAFWTLIIILLAVMPVLDLAWNEPTLDQRQGARCQLHANPAAAFEPVCLVVVLAAGLFLPFEPFDRSPLMGPSIFIPPRL